MAASTAPLSFSAPAPEECQHPEPVRGVMAHEFAHYDGALGPEGARRTVTYYGPVVGGLPIGAWHCEVCGLLRLDFPDGRREERRLFPGPQPGLIAVPSVVAAGQDQYGEQARVSGLSVPPPLYERLYAEEVGIAAPRRLPSIEIPRLDLLGWTNVVGLVTIIAGLFVAAVVAVAGYSVPGSEAPLVASLATVFVVLVAINALSPAWKRIFPMPPLSPSVAETARVRGALDGATKAAVWLLAIASIGLFIAAILAVAGYNTSPAEGPVFLLSIGAAVIGAITVVAGAVGRRGR